MSSSLRLVAAGCICAVAAQQPNVIIFLADDLDRSDVGYINGGSTYTPAIDRLFSDGMTFNKGYVTSAVCTPSRFSLLMGIYASRGDELITAYPPPTQVLLQWDPHFMGNEMTMPMVLKEHGYNTGIVGKWMLGRLAESLVPVSDANDLPALEYNYNVLRNEIQKYGFDVHERVYQTNLKYLPRHLIYHNIDWTTGGALDFIDSTPSGTPFFLYYSYSAPHTPSLSKSVDRTEYVTPLGIIDNPPQSEHLNPRSTVRTRAQANGVTDEDDQAYTWMDDAVDTILAKLETKQLAHNTLIFFLSDHERSVRGKFSCYEAARVTFAAYWPAAMESLRARKRKVDALIANIDIFPTVLDAAGIAPPQSLHRFDGQSLLPILQGSIPGNWRDHLLLEMAYTRAIVTSDDYKYLAIRYPDELQHLKDQGIVLDHAGIPEGDPSGKFARYNLDNKFPAYFDQDQLYALPNELDNLWGTDAPLEATMKELMAEECAKLPHKFGEFVSDAAPPEMPQLGVGYTIDFADALATGNKSVLQVQGGKLELTDSVYEAGVVWTLAQAPGPSTLFYIQNDGNTRLCAIRKEPVLATAAPNSTVDPDSNSCKWQIEQSSHPNRFYFICYGSGRQMRLKDSGLQVVQFRHPDVSRSRVEIAEAP